MVILSIKNTPIIAQNRPITTVSIEMKIQNIFRLLTKPMMPGNLPTPNIISHIGIQTVSLAENSKLERHPMINPFPSNTGDTKEK